MKLAKSLLLGSAAAIAATAGAQAADLPFRKAAPVEYVRVCDWTGAGYWYIPGTDTCLRIGGFVRAEFEYNSGGRAFVPGISNTVTPGPGSRPIPFEQSGLTLSGGGYISGRNRDETGFFVRGRLEADTRTQTAYGTLRAFVRYQIDRISGAENYFAAASPAGQPQGNGTNAYIDKAFIQFAGITGGRVQSFFDFGADPYGFEGVPTTDQSTEVFAYTATFGGGFSATISVENPNERRFGIQNTATLVSAGTLNPTTAAYAGDRIPDIVGNLRVDQAWGAAQLSGAFHQLNTTANVGTPLTAAASHDEDGWAVRGGVLFKLPMLAAGDEFQVEGGYQSGAYSYQNGNTFSGGYGSPIIVGGLFHPSVDAVAVGNVLGGYTLAKAEGYSVSGGFVHYFTPQFQNIVLGGYEHVKYDGARNIAWYRGGLAPSSEYRVGDQFNWFPVKNLQIGIEVMYIKINQRVPGTAADPVAGAPVVALPATIKADPDAFEARLRMERDF